MAGGLWDYDEPPPIDDCNGSQDVIELDDSSDDERVKKSKKRGRAPAKGKKAPLKQTVALDLDDDDDLEGPGPGPSSQDDMFSELANPPAKRRTRSPAKPVEKPAPLPAPVAPVRKDKTVEEAQAILDQYKRALDCPAESQEDDVENVDPDVPMPVSMLMMQIPTCVRSAQPGPSQAAAGPSSAPAEPAPAADTEPKITLGCKYSGGELKIKFRPSDPISKLLAAFMKHHPNSSSLPTDTSKYKVKFDGEVMGLNDPGTQWELEDGYTIDFVWKA